MTVWDPAKAQANFRKHGVRFSDAEGVLLDPQAITVDDDSAREPRYVSIGLDTIGRVIVAVKHLSNRRRAVDVRSSCHPWREAAV